MFSRFFLFLLIFVNFFLNLNADEKQSIINRLKNINNITFNFKQITNVLRAQGEPDYIDEITIIGKSENSEFISDDDTDELYNQALDIIKTEGKASTSFLQRKLQIGYNRAARIIDMMEEKGIVSKANHVGKREVFINIV